ncbi:crotonyl-CoA carboxylase/reductase [Streptomyces sp. NBC_00443]|uniref:crotonyl-CoA carboxylase/reductase n=1 Tax=Streptomyces sp. NBC_00443 TaxID=2975743 RepID=UPI002E1E6EAB
MDSLTEALLSGAPEEVLAREKLPDHFDAAHLRAEDVGMFEGAQDKDVRRSIRVGPVAMPELAPDEVLVAVMASAINYNTVWSATFEPVPTFRFLERFGRQGGHAARHDLPYQVIGSDASGVVVRVGSGVRRWRPGAHVVVSCVQVDDHEPATHADAMLGAEQRIWGYETNFGGLARYAVVKASQLLPKPGHLTWEESAGVLLTAATSYRMLISDKGARIKLGDVVLIWGATGGLGAFAVQLVKQAGGIPVGVVGSEQKAKALRALGCDVIVNRTEIGLGDATTPEETIEQGKRLGRFIRREVGEDPSVAFDYIGRATFGVSVFVVRRGGTVVTCGSSTGYQHTYDNRYLWMNSKRIVGSHAANLQEQAELNRLVALGKIAPVLSSVYRLDEVGEAARLVQTNQHLGKVAVLCQAPQEGLGVTDPQLRERIGADALNPLRSL